MPHGFEAWYWEGWTVVLEQGELKEVPKLYLKGRQASPLFDEVPKRVAKKFWEYILACDNEVREECIDCPGR